MSDNVDVFDEYARTRRDNPTFSPDLIDANSGHRLLCPRCRAFRRMRIEIVHRDDHSVLRVTCKTCNEVVDFILRAGAQFMPEPWMKREERFTRRRVREFLLRKEASK